jgi:hypothetical protein
LGKGKMKRENIGRNIFKDKGNGMIMGTVGRGKLLGIVKNRFVFREKRLDVKMNSR